MDDTRIPKQLLYGELCLGSRAHGGQRLRFKDTLRLNLKKCKIGPDWETLALNRSEWRKAVKDGVKQFESNRVDKAAVKRALRKGQHHPLIADTTTFPCQICGRLLLTRAGLSSHMKTHRNKEQNKQRNVPPGPTLLVHDFSLCNCATCTNNKALLVPQNKCHICDKVCKSKGGLTLHLKVHNK